jgi:hypothetical protein
MQPQQKQPPAEHAADDYFPSDKSFVRNTLHDKYLQLSDFLELILAKPNLFMKKFKQEDVQKQFLNKFLLNC